MAFLKETIDFSNDGKFSEKDLDIAWAYLQTKELYNIEQADDGATKTINSANFSSKVLETYEKNLASNITSQPGGAGTTQINKLPGFIKTGADLAIPKRIKMKNYWTFTDVKSTKGVFDSKTGVYSTFTNCSWQTNTTAKDVPLFNLSKTGVLNLDDTGNVRNDRNWALFIRGATRAITSGVLVSKGGFQIALGKDLIRASSGPVGVKWGERQHNYFQVLNTDAFNYKDLELVVLRENISIRIYINGEELEMTVPSEQPEPLVGADSDSTLKLDGSVWRSLDKIFISEIDTTGDDIVSPSGVYTGLPFDYKYNHDLDLYDSSFNYKSLIPDNAGSFARVFNTPLWENGVQSAKTEWKAPPVVNKPNGYVNKTSVLKLTGDDYLSPPQVNFRAEFTISFWVNTNYFGPWLTFVGEQESLETGYSTGTRRKTAAQAWYWKLASATNKKYIALHGSADDQADSWNHIVIVKSGNTIGVWTNGICNKYSIVTYDDGIYESLGRSVPKFSCYAKWATMYLSHLKIAEYAVMNPPIDNIGLKTTWNEVEELKKTSTTQRLSDYVPDWV